MMGTCPACGVHGYPPHDGFALEETGDSRLVALPPGTYSIAGVSPKIAAREVPVVRLSHSCGWSALGSDDGHDHLDIHEILPPSIGAQSVVIAASIRLALQLAVDRRGRGFTVEPAQPGGFQPIRVTREFDGATLDIADPRVTGAPDVWRIEGDPEPASFEELIGRLTTWVRP